MLVIFSRKTLRSCVLGAITLLALLGLGFWTLSMLWPVESFHAQRLPETTIVIDPGHGGFDGGAVSRAGEKESSVNLAIAQKLDMLLRFYGLSTKLTREDDSAIHDEDAATLRARKASDIRRRVAITQETPGALLVSIHQNSFPESRYHGLQVFFSDVASQPLAQRMQENARGFVDATNQRQALRIAPTVYLMKHVHCPAVLVECGFLSNEEEAKALQSADYQRKIAVAIAAACIQQEENGP